MTRASARSIAATEDGTTTVVHGDHVITAPSRDDADAEVRRRAQPQNDNGPLSDRVPA